MVSGTQCENPRLPTGACGPVAWLLRDARSATRAAPPPRGDLLCLAEEPKRTRRHGEDRERQSTASGGLGWFLQHHRDNAEAKEEQELLGNALTPHCARAPSKSCPQRPPVTLPGLWGGLWPGTVEDRPLPVEQPSPARPAASR